MKNRAIFLDRDGVINKRLINDYVKKVEEFELLPFVKDALKLLKKKGFLLIIITNQQGIGKGLMSEEDLEKIHQHMLSQLPEIDDIFYCPHLEGSCNCRKPNIGLFLKAKEKWNIDLNSSWMIGDDDKDIIAGKNAGCKTIKISPKEDPLADYIVDNLQEAAKIILNNEKLK